MSRLAFIMFVVMQVLDGLLTYIGVSIFGISAEGNSNIRETMLSLGVVPALIIYKGAGVLMGHFIYRHTQWYTTVIMWSLVIFYGIAAILPWTYILGVWLCAQ